MKNFSSYDYYDIIRYIKNLILQEREDTYEYEKEYYQLERNIFTGFA